jgi:cytoskeletal protein RodZ
MANALFKTKEIKIDTLGEYLQQVRSSLNFDIKTVSLLTQIKPNYVELLEAGTYNKLPADVYIRGFLKSLADFYHIKERTLIDQYEKERGFDIHVPLTQFEKRKWLSFTPTTMIVGISLIVASVAAGYVFLQIRSVLAPPYLNLTEPNTDQTVVDNSVVVSGTSEVGAEIFINDQPVLASQNGEFTENLLLSPGLNVIEVTAKNKFGKISKAVRQVTSQAVATKTATNQAVNLTISIGPSSAWVYLEADGVVVQRGTMLAGSTKVVSAKEGIILTSANAGSTAVTYNGKDLGKLGRENEVIRNIEFSAQTGTTMP